MIFVKGNFAVLVVDKSLMFAGVMLIRCEIELSRDCVVDLFHSPPITIMKKMFVSLQLVVVRSS